MGGAGAGGPSEHVRRASGLQGRGLGCGPVAVFLCTVNVLGHGRRLVAPVFMWGFMEFCSRLLKMPLREETLCDEL